MKSSSSSNQPGKNTVQREILLITDSGYAHPLVPNPEKSSWTGVLNNLLPDPGNELFTWHVLPADHYLWISQGICPKPIDMRTSIDPYFFLLTCSFN